MIPEGNYNGEYGLALTILGQKSPGKNPLGWICVFVFGFMRIFDRDFPQTLLLEYGIDRPGEMQFMTSFAPVDMAIFTTLSPSHVQNFSDSGDYIAEKKYLVNTKTRVVIVNADDDYQKDILATHRY